MLRSSVYSVPADALPLDGHGNLEAGYVLVTRVPLPANADHPFERHVLHAEVGKAPPANVASVVVDGSVTEWTPSMIAAAKPSESPYVLEAEWEEVVDGKTVRKRGKEVDVPSTITPLAAELVPHLWAGEVP